MTCYAGIDPSIASLGLSAVRRLPQRYALVVAKTVRTSPKDDLLVRLDALTDEISAFLRSVQPSLLTIEDQQGVQVGKWTRRNEDGVQFKADNSKTLIVQGIAIATARVFRIPVLLLQPQQVKIAALGKGAKSASKQEVQAAIERLTGTWLAQDSADATAIAISGHQRRFGSMRVMAERRTA